MLKLKKVKLILNQYILITWEKSIQFTKYGEILNMFNSFNVINLLRYIKIEDSSNYKVR